MVFWAHLLSLSRIPLGIILLCSDSALERAWICILAGITDALDGWLARTLAQPSQLGALLDPIGDKIFAFCALLAAYRLGSLSIADIAILLSREGALLCYVVSWMVLKKKRGVPLRFGSVWSSKLFTVLQFVVLGLALTQFPIPQSLMWALLLCSGGALAEWIWTLR